MICPGSPVISPKPFFSVSTRSNPLTCTSSRAIVRVACRVHPFARSAGKLQTNSPRTPITKTATSARSSRSTSFFSIRLIKCLLNCICTSPLFFPFKFGKFLLPPRFLTALSVPKAPTREPCFVFQIKRSSALSSPHLYVPGCAHNPQYNQPPPRNAR